MARKPAWTIAKERDRRSTGTGTVWLFGLHAVRDALTNPVRKRLSLVLTRNAADRLAEAVAASGMAPRIVEPRNFDAPLDLQSVHQGAALEVCRWTGDRSPRSARPMAPPRACCCSTG